MAQIALDFPTQASVCGGVVTEAATMDIDNTAAQQAVGTMLAAIQVRLEEATRIARAATVRISVIVSVEFTGW